MPTFYFDPHQKSFLNGDFQAAYSAARKWPESVVELTDDQYEEFNGSIPDGKVLGADDAGFPVWVDAPPPPPLPIDALSVRKRIEIEAGRKDAEALGVVINNVRYAGDPSNRQALREALDLAAETGMEVFPSWKDSDGEFRPQLPVADIHQALLSIAERRSQLIAREGELNTQIDAALAAKDRDALEAVSWPD